MSTLYLLGAGPGDPELITLKGIKCLQKADVVLYDALASTELLNYCKEDCELIYVGKKPGIHQYQQIYINDMIVDLGKRYASVVRLKGGDPFVFGRGHEELEHAQSHGIEVEVIPGISSAISVPGLNHIPLTKRGVNESFWVVTGTTKNLELSSDLQLAAQSTATVVILMGMKHLDKIVEIFSQHRGHDEPIGIIQNGSTAHEKSICGRLDNIEALVNKNRISSPAIIIIGQVVNHSSQKIQKTVEKHLTQPL